MSLIQIAQEAYMRSEAKQEPVFPTYYFDIDWEKYGATSAMTDIIADEVELAASRRMTGMAGTIYNMPFWGVGIFLENLIGKYEFKEVAVKMNFNNACEYEFRWM